MIAWHILGHPCTGRIIHQVVIHAYKVESDLATVTRGSCQLASIPCRTEGENETVAAFMENVYYALPHSLQFPVAVSVLAAFVVRYLVLGIR